MKSLILGLGIFALIGCGSPNKKVYDSASLIELQTNEDTLLFVSHTQVDSVPFITLKMNYQTAYISLIDSIIPSESDSTIALCVEAAFTGELLKEFKTYNIAGDYVINGILHKGYECKANTGFLYADKKIFTIGSSENSVVWIDKAQNNGGSLFQQILIVHNGRNVYSGTPIKPNSENIYRSACIMNDGNFAVIQSLKALPLNDYIESLINLGVSAALYLDKEMVGTMGGTANRLNSRWKTVRLSNSISNQLAYH